MFPVALDYFQHIAERDSQLIPFRYCRPLPWYVFPIDVIHSMC